MAAENRKHNSNTNISKHTRKSFYIQQTLENHQMKLRKTNLGDGSALGKEEKLISKEPRKPLATHDALP